MKTELLSEDEILTLCLTSKNELLKAIFLQVTLAAPGNSVSGYAHKIDLLTLPMFRAIEAATIAKMQEQTTQRDELLRMAREEIDIDDKLLANCNRVLDAIPPCPVHGIRCISHAMEWIEKQTRPGWVMAPGIYPVVDVEFDMELFDLCTIGDYPGLYRALIARAIAEQSKVQKPAGE